MGRTTLTAYPDGGSTTTTYNDTANTIETQIAETSTTAIESLVQLDGLGRKTQSQLVSDPAGTDYTGTTYDSGGRVLCVSNPHRSVSSTSDGQTCTTYDVLNRPTLITEQDNNQHMFNYSLNSTTSIDENGNSWTRKTDALGRLIQVIEPGSLNTNYTYNALGDLVLVIQHGTSTDTARQRSFTYDSLSRLITATNPEAGTLSYSYDANGNVSSKTAPQPGAPAGSTQTLTTNFSYDALNRLTDKYFSDGLTPNQHFRYDQTSTWMGANYNTIGRLSEAYTDQDRRYYGSGSPPACNPQSSSIQTTIRPMAIQSTVNGPMNSTLMTPWAIRRVSLLHFHLRADGTPMKSTSITILQEM